MPSSRAKGTAVADLRRGLRHPWTAFIVGTAIASVACGDEVVPPRVPRVATQRKGGTEAQRRKRPSTVESALKGNMLTIRVDSNVVECRTVTTTPVSGGKTQTTETDWELCDSDREADVMINLTAGSLALTGKTNDAGKATIDVTTIVRSTSDPIKGYITAILPGGEKVLAEVYLGEAPAYARWKALDDAQKRSAAAEAGAKKDAEDAVRRRQMAADQQERRRDALPIGRTYILTKVRSPSSVRFVGDVVVLECPQGIVTMHEFDAQNAFGAVIRSTWEIWQNARDNRISHADCTTGMSCGGLFLNKDKSQEERCRAEFP